LDFSRGAVFFAFNTHDAVDRHIPEGGPGRARDQHADEKDQLKMTGSYNGRQKRTA
jgi:hypothetical protein